jgi:hypothetical protein
VRPVALLPVAEVPVVGGLPVVRVAVHARSGYRADVTMRDGPRIVDRFCSRWIDDWRGPEALCS